MSTDNVEISTATDDPKWDDFLERSPQGHFQQSSAWARYKRSDGWAVVRAIIREGHGGAVRGGFQLLHKETRCGRIGYISKGPVLEDATAGGAKVVGHWVWRAARAEGLRAAVLQLPDGAEGALLSEFGGGCYVDAGPLGVIDATLEIDLTGGADEVVRRFRSSTKNKYNKARRLGLDVREAAAGGGGDDVEAFYRLMVATCDRQGVTPNPASLESMRALWRALHGRGMLRVVFAVSDGELVSGILTVGFGSRMSIFKTGWAGRVREGQPNNLVVCEALKWASENGFATGDFVGLERSLAETMLDGGKISKEQNQSRDAFKLGFGGQARLLPKARILIPNPALRTAFRIASRSRVMAGALKLKL